jgi:hypothetical protein
MTARLSTWPLAPPGHPQVRMRACVCVCCILATRHLTAFVCLQAVWCWGRIRSATEVRPYASVLQLHLSWNLERSVHDFLIAILTAASSPLRAFCFQQPMGSSCARLQGASLRSRSSMATLQSCACGTVCCQR